MKAIYLEDAQDKIRRRNMQIKELKENKEKDAVLIKKLFEITYLLTDSTKKAYNRTDKETVKQIRRIISR